MSAYYSNFLTMSLSHLNTVTLYAKYRNLTKTFGFECNLCKYHYTIRPSPQDIAQAQRNYTFCFWIVYVVTYIHCCTPTCNTLKNTYNYSPSELNLTVFFFFFFFKPSVTRSTSWLHYGYNQIIYLGRRMPSYTQW
jgi:hypothetical protein